MCVSVNVEGGPYIGVVCTYVILEYSGIQFHSGFLFQFGEDGNGQSSFLGQNATHSLLLCFLWVLKNLEVELLRQWWSQLKISDINKLLGVLEVCVQTFEYKVREGREGRREEGRIGEGREDREGRKGKGMEG